MKIIKKTFQFRDDNELLKWTLMLTLCMSNLPLELISVDDLESLTCFTEINGRKKHKRNGRCWYLYRMKSQIVPFGELQNEVEPCFTITSSMGIQVYIMRKNFKLA